MHIAKGLGHWRTLGFYSERNGQPVEDTAETIKHSCVHFEADGLPSGSQTVGRHPVLLPDQNTAPSSHLGDAVTPNFHSKAPREENVFRVPASPPAESEVWQPTQTQGGVQTLASPYSIPSGLGVSSCWYRSAAPVPASRGCERVQAAGACDQGGPGPVTSVTLCPWWGITPA